MSDEQRMKISQAHKGKKKPWSGKYMTEEHRKAISKRMIGNKLCLGRELTEEIKSKIRTSNLGKKHNISAEGMARMKTKNYVVWNKGKSKPKPIKTRQKVGRKIGSVPWNKGLAGYRSGEKNPMWKKDRSTLSKKQQRNDSAYAEWRKEVRNRDGWKCKTPDENCTGKVVAHHIFPWSKYPQLRYEIGNGITLCKFHHPTKRLEEIRLIEIFQKLIIN